MPAELLDITFSPKHKRMDNKMVIEKNRMLQLMCSALHQKRKQERREGREGGKKRKKEAKISQKARKSAGS